MNDVIGFFFSFRFFHFLFVSSVIVYLIKTRLNPLIDKEIVTQKNEHEQLIDALAQVKKSNQETIASIEKQRLQAQNLLDRIAIWSSAVQQKKEQKNILQKQSEEALAKFAKDQEHALLIEYYTHEMVPDSIREAHHILEKNFESVTLQEQFLEHSLVAMKASKK